MVDQTPAARQRIAAEEHFANPEYFDAFNRIAATSTAESVRYDTMFNRTPVYLEKFTNIEARLSEMDRVGLDMQVLMHVGVQDFGEDEGTALARLANDRFAATIRSHPVRRLCDDCAAKPAKGRSGNRSCDVAAGMVFSRFLSAMSSRRQAGTLDLEEKHPAWFV